MSGPVIATPIMEVPPAAPGLTVELELELVSDKATHVDPCNPEVLGSSQVILDNRC